jgi:hypothetical protein
MFRAASFFSAYSGSFRRTINLAGLDALEVGSGRGGEASYGKRSVHGAEEGR